MKRALIFDMDGVIVDNSEYHYKAWMEFASRHGFNITQNDVKSWLGNTSRMVINRLYNKELDNSTIKVLSNEKEEIYREIYSDWIKPVNGLKIFLELMSDNGILLGIATAASTANVDFVLKKTQLSSFFKIVTDASMIKNGKPDPEVFLKTAELLGVEPSHSIVVEDAMHGITAARSAGMKVIALTTTHLREELGHADLVVKDFSHLKLKDIQNLFNRII